MEVFVSLLCWVVHEPPYQDYSSVLQPHFCHGSSCMDHCTAFPHKSGAHPIVMDYPETTPVNNIANISFTYLSPK